MSQSDTDKLIEKAKLWDLASGLFGAQGSQTYETAKFISELGDALTAERARAEAAEETINEVRCAFQGA